MRRFFLIIFLLLAGMPAFCVDSSYAFKHINSSHGLSASNVKSILRDSKGFMWFGTKNGLNLYDGNDIETVKCYDAEKKHGNDNIGALYEDKSGKIWIGTDRGLFILDPKDYKIHYQDTKAKDGTLANNYILRILGDQAGNVWAIGPTQGIFRYSPKGEVEYFKNPPEHNGNRCFYTDFTITPSGNIYAITNYSDIYVYDATEKKFRMEFENNGEVPAPSGLSKVISDSKGNLYFSTLDGSLFVYTPRRDKAPVAVPFSKSGKLYLRDIALFGDDLWIGTHNGLCIMNLTSGKETELHENMLDPFSLSDNSVSTIYRDYEGNGWIGTMFAGVDYLPSNPFRFEIYGREAGRGSMRVRGLAVADNGKVWIGTENGGMHLLDPATRTITSPVASPAGSSGVIHFVKAYDDEIFAGYTHNGILKISPNGKMNILPTDKIPGSDGSGYAYLKDSAGNEWIGFGGALARRKPGEEKFTRVDETGTNWIFQLFEDSDKNIWIGTMGNGLWKYTPKTGKFKSYTYDDGEVNPNGLRSNSINSIMQDSHGNVWLSTDRGGLSRYNKKTDDFTTFGIEEGLPDNVVYTVLEDSRGYLWFGTNKGLVKFSPSTRKIKVFTMADGLPFNEFSYNSASVDNNGNFWFGGNDGIISFNPLLDGDSQSKHPVYFTKVSLLDIREDKLPQSSGSEPGQSVVLPSDYSGFSVTVASPEFGITGRRSFYYRLLPVSHEWTALEGNKITFANLASGNYTLQVRLGDSEESPVSELKIKILPPWWRSGWAICSYIIIGILIIVLLMMWIQLRNKKKITLREKEIAAEKEKELYRDKVEFFTTIAHEIRTPLSLIDIPLEAIEENGINDPKTPEYLKVMRQNTRRLLHLSRELLDFGKLDSRRLTTKKEVIDIAALLRETVERFRPAMELNGKTLSVDIRRNKIMVFTDKEAVTKILSNLLNNALKYTKSTIDITLDEADGFVKISVASNGPKITDKDRNMIFEPFYQSEDGAEKKNGVGIGLPLARSLAAVLGGNLVLENNVSGENIFTLTIPVGNTEQEDKSVADMDKANYVFEEESNQTKLRSNGYHILVVEDNDSIRNLLREQLQKEFIVETAGNGVEALDKLKDSRFDLVVTDIMMPEMDGMELCRRVKEDTELSSIPIVFITAKNDLDSKVKGLKMGAEAYIDKPFSIKYLIQTVKSLLENRRRERESFSKKPFFNVDSIQTNKADEEFIKKCMDAITSHLSEEDFNVESLCEILAMSRSNLLRKIKAIFNMSPSELIRVVKLKKAAELIQDGRYRIGEICEMIGISSPSYFSKLFFKQFDITPKAFEKQCQEKRRAEKDGNVEKTKL